MHTDSCVVDSQLTDNEVTESLASAHFNDPLVKLAIFAMRQAQKSHHTVLLLVCVTTNYAKGMYGEMKHL